MKNSWVSVNDKFPTMWEKSDYRSKEVLVTDGIHVGTTSYHVTGKRWCAVGRNCCIKTITHWQPIILPEKEVKE